MNEQVVWTCPTDPRTRIVRVDTNHFQQQRLYDTPGSAIWCDEVPRHPDDGADEIDRPDAFDELMLTALRAPPLTGRTMTAPLSNRSVHAHAPGGSCHLCEPRKIQCATCGDCGIVELPEEDFANLDAGLHKYPDGEEIETMCPCPDCDSESTS